MWKLKDFAEDADRERNAKRIKIELESLRQLIPQIFHLEVGINILKIPTPLTMWYFCQYLKTRTTLTSTKNTPIIAQSQSSSTK